MEVHFDYGEDEINGSPEKDKKPGKSRCIVNIPSDFARDNLIYLQEIGEQQLDCLSDSQKEIRSSCLFFIVIGGVGKLEYEEDTYVLSAGDCAFLDCRKPYIYYALDGILAIDYMYFDGLNMQEIHKEYLSQGGTLCFRAHGSKTYTRRLKQIYDAVASDFESDVKEMEIYEKLVAFLSLLMKVGENTWKYPHRIVQKQDLQAVKNFLEQDYQEKITLDGLAEMFYINKFHLTRLFREQFEISVNSYLIRVRIDHAKSLLRSSDLSIEKAGKGQLVFVYQFIPVYVYICNSI